MDPSCLYSRDARNYRKYSYKSRPTTPFLQNSKPQFFFGLCAVIKNSLTIFPVFHHESTNLICVEYIHAVITAAQFAKYTIDKWFSRRNSDVNIYMSARFHTKLIIIVKVFVAIKFVNISYVISDGKVPVDETSKERKVLTYSLVQLIIIGVFVLLGLIYSLGFLYFNISKRRHK